MRNGVAISVLVALSLVGLAGCMTENGSPSTTAIFSAAYGSTSDAPRRLFISGHSLTDRPLPDYVAAIAGGAGHALDWNMQHLEGSSLRARTQGDGSPPWNGYGAGTDRDRRPINVLEELAPGPDGVVYDTLVLNEVHTLLESLIWNDTIGHAVDYEERFFASNPDGQTYLYAAWLNVDDLDDPARWVAYEKAATRAWQCTATMINGRLAEKGRKRPVRLIPAAQALAALVEQAASEAGVGGLSAGTSRATMERLFADDVHLTDTGNYYIALISHIALYGNLPADPWVAAGLDPEQAGALQRFARDFMAQWRRQQAEVRIDCPRYLADEFAGTYLAYVRDTKWRADDGRLRAWYKWARFSRAWPKLLRGGGPASPFRRADPA
ncbi:MAG: hypothetical protein J7499_02515 [Sphingopyxis sp.]|nr:hypothetical protein [Sphingopyxis sp.]